MPVGSLPPETSAHQLWGLLDLLADSDRQVWVDTSGETLKNVIAYPGIHIKVNGNEAGKVLGIEVKDLNSAR